MLPDSRQFVSDKTRTVHNDYRVHPDIYMSEILIGLRNIERRQLLIMKKLGIDDEPVI